MSLMRSSVLKQCSEFSKRAESIEPAPEAMEQQCKFTSEINTDLPALEYCQWAQGLVITGTGFHGAGRQHIRQAAEAAGAVYQGDLTRGQTTHLACRSVSSAKEGDKYRRAAQWGIPAVSWIWVQQSTLAGVRLPLDGYYSDATAEAATSRSRDPGSGPAALPACSSPLETPRDQQRPAEERLPSQVVGGIPVKTRLAAGDGASQHAWGSGSAWGKENAGNGGSSRTINTLPAPSQLPQPQLAASHSIRAAADAAGIADITMAVSDISLRGSCHPAASPSGMRPDSCNHHGSSEEGGEPRSPCSGGGSPEPDVQCGQCSPPPSIQSLPSPPVDRTGDGFSGSEESDSSGGDSAMPSAPHGPTEDLLHARHRTGSLTRGHVEHMGASIPPSDGTLSSARPCLDTTSSAVSLWGTPPDSRHHVPHPSAPAAVSSGKGLGVHALKLLARQPRGNTVKDFHGLINLKRVRFAEQLQLVELALTLSTRNKRTCVELRSPPIYGESAGGREALAGVRLSEVAAEIQAVYQLPSGEWWVECCRFFSAGDISKLAAETSKSIPLPFGFDKRCELLRAVNRMHCPASDVTGTRQVRRSKQAASTVCRKPRDGMFWRSCFDADLVRCVTDAPVQTFAL